MKSEAPFFSFIFYYKTNFEGFCAIFSVIVRKIFTSFETDSELSVIKSTSEVSEL